MRSRGKLVFWAVGALLEGGYVATCRHVWRLAAPPEEPSGVPREVEIEFPFGAKEKVGDGEKPVAPTRRARLADDCSESEDSAPDLVLLRLVAPLSIPGGVLVLHPAVQIEVGPGRAHTYLASRKRCSAVDGTIDPAADPDGLRQFRGVQSQGYWFEKGSSGSPVFLEYGEQLAGIIALSELGANEGESHLREAFVVPATTIRKFLIRLQARGLPDGQSNNFFEQQNVLTTRPLDVSFRTGAANDPAANLSNQILHSKDKKRERERILAEIAKIEQDAKRRIRLLSDALASIDA